jgi:thiosulfate/3-mercaptopyruvate sulfurtransferase
MVDAFTALWGAWRAERDRELAEPDGILSVTSIDYLGTDPVEIPGVPGRWSAGADGVRVDLPDGADLADEGGALRGSRLIGPIAPGVQRKLRSGDIRVEIFVVAGRVVLRTRDTRHRLRTGFRGTPAFPPSRDWVISGRWIPTAPTALVHVDSAAKPLARDVVTPGQVEFELEGRTHRLIATETPGRPDTVTLLFRDRTSGVTTYAAVRELLVARPEGTEVTLDFNRAQNKNCAYTDYAICPLPPNGNVIDAAVEAGERIPYEREPGRGVTIDAEKLARELASAHPPVVLDVRWRLDRPDGRPEYLEGHLPGAVYVSLDDELAAHGVPADGRHPLPTAAALQAAARRWGVDDGDAVVVYDDLKSLSAARAWWLLRWAGVADVRILDGGYREWVAAGLPVEAGDVVPTPGDVVLTGGELPTITLEEAAVLPEHGVLLDARASERYRGENEPIDPRAGHIPGALNRPSTANVDERGRFLPAETLREHFGALAAEHDTVGVYCGSGVTAAHEIAALAIAGISAALYPGSWSQWSNHGDRPVATGADG